MRYLQYQLVRDVFHQPYNTQISSRKAILIGRLVQAIAPLNFNPRSEVTRGHIEVVLLTPKN